MRTEDLPICGVSYSQDYQVWSEHDLAGTLEYGPPSFTKLCLITRMLRPVEHPSNDCVDVRQLSMASAIGQATPCLTSLQTMMCTPLQRHDSVARPPLPLCTVAQVHSATRPFGTTGRSALCRASLAAPQKIRPGRKYRRSKFECFLHSPSQPFDLIFCTSSTTSNWTPRLDVPLQSALDDHQSHTGDSSLRVNWSVLHNGLADGIHGSSADSETRHPESPCRFESCT